MPNKQTTPDPTSKPVKIKYIGRTRWDKGKRKQIAVAAPIEQFSDRGRLVTMPPADFQGRQRVFEHPDGALIVQAFPHLYKRVIS